MLLLAVCLEYLFIHCCILYTLLYILQEGKPAKGFFIFRFVLGRLLNSYAFMQRMPAKIYRHVCIHSTDTGIIARFSAMSNTKLQFSQHGVAGKPRSKRPPCKGAVRAADWGIPAALWGRVHSCEAAGIPPASQARPPPFDKGGFRALPVHSVTNSLTISSSSGKMQFGIVPSSTARIASSRSNHFT